MENLQPFVTLAVILLIAFLVETLVEFTLGTAFDKVEKIKPFKWMLQYFAVAVGIYFAFVYQFDLIYLLSEYLGAGLEITAAGITITGISIGKGSNYIHQIISEHFPMRETSPDIQTRIEGTAHGED